jgi:hypothetical protein
MGTAARQEIASGVSALYGRIADVVVVIHLAFILFVAFGALLAWRWRRLVWVHAPAVVYAVAILTIHFDCPLTDLEKYLRRQAGEQQYRGSFVGHYVTNVVYPGALTPVLQGAAALCIVAGYAGLLVQTRRRFDAASLRAADSVRSDNP